MTVTVEVRFSLPPATTVSTTTTTVHHLQDLFLQSNGSDSESCAHSELDDATRLKNPPYITQYDLRPCGQLHLL